MRFGGNVCAFLSLARRFVLSLKWNGMGPGAAIKLSTEDTFQTNSM